MSIPTVLVDEPLQCSMGGVPFNKAHLDARDAAIRRAEAEIAEWRQAAEVEAGLRREFLARAEKAEAENARLRTALKRITSENIEPDLKGRSRAMVYMRGES